MSTAPRPNVTPEVARQVLSGAAPLSALFGVSKPQLAEMAMFSLDYPHSVCLWPDTERYIEEATANCDPVSKEKILAGNAKRVFNLG